MPMCPMQRVGFIAYPDFQVLSLCTISVFECANMLAPEPLYDLHMLSETGGPIGTSSGLILQTKKFDEAKFDTLIVLGFWSTSRFFRQAWSRMSGALREARRVASICTGALVLAEAGLFENRRVTTHWAYARYFRQRFPNVNLDEDRIFVIDRSIWTSAGCTACIDLMLAMVEEVQEGHWLRRYQRVVYVPSTRWRPNATFALGTRTEGGLHPERIGICALCDFPDPFDGKSGLQRPRISAPVSSAARFSRKRDIRLQKQLKTCELRRQD